MTPPPGATVASALREARTRGVDVLDAQLMLARLLERPRAWLIAHDDAAVADAVSARFADWTTRRAAGEPLAYLFGEKEFHGLTLAVDARVLVPRPDTETLVDWAVELLSTGALRGVEAPAVVDLGTGSGAIALAVKRAHPPATVCAVDASRDALAVARANAERLSIGVRFAEGDWWEALDGQCFDLALANPPYIADTDVHLAALRHEPRAALVSPGDGLHDLQRLIEGAPSHLCAGGWLLLEHGWQQADAVQALLRSAGFGEVATRADLGGQPRCTGGRRR